MRLHTLRLARLGGLASLFFASVSACGSSSTPSSSASDGGSSSAAFTPGFVPGDGGASTSGATTGLGTSGETNSSGSVVTTPVTSGSSSGATSSAVHTSSSVAIPSSGIAITVEPDGSGDAEVLLSAIQNAKAAVHVEMYLLTNNDYINALETLARNGIDVKVLLNQTFPSGTTASETNASSYTTLQQGGVDVKWAPADPDGSESGYTHEKAVIIDPGTTGEQVWIMTMNLDTDAPKYNREYLAQDTNSGDITEAEQIFLADWAGTGINPSGQLVVAPTNAEPMLLDLVNMATQTIDMEAEEIDDTGVEADIFSALTSKAKSGVAVRLVIEDSTESSQATAVSALEAAGGQVRGYAYSSSGNGLDIHAKTLVVDGKTAYVGSENFTGGSLGYNRELGVIFAETTEIAKIQTAINSDFAGGSAYSSN
jgi:phosphatidylserine/phosphatidylglycerophosphate/cardiolipin synthase-like enzyme